MDMEIDRLLDSLDQTSLDNTIVIYMGDNGTPQRVIDFYTNGHSKGSLYQGGVSVPLIVSGNGVTRQNVREDALVTATDLYATIAELAGVESQSIHDSKSFASLLSDENASSEDYALTAFESSSTTGWTVRASDYKLIEFENGDQELYQVDNNFSETTNLLPTTDPTLLAKLNDLETAAASLTDTSTTAQFEPGTIYQDPATGAEYPCNSDHPRPFAPRRAPDLRSGVTD